MFFGPGSELLFTPLGFPVATRPYGLFGGPQIGGLGRRARTGLSVFGIVEGWLCAVTTN